MFFRITFAVAAFLDSFIPFLAWLNFFIICYVRTQTIDRERINIEYPKRELVSSSCKDVDPNSIAFEQANCDCDYGEQLSSNMVHLNLNLTDNELRLKILKEIRYFLANVFNENMIRTYIHCQKGINFTGLD